MSLNDTEHCEISHEHKHDDKISEFKKMMPDEDKLYDLAELFKCFGDSTRIRILFALFESEMCVCDIANTLDMTQSAVSISLKS